MFIECMDLMADTASSPVDFASLLRQEIYDKTGCTASVGIGLCVWIFAPDVCPDTWEIKIKVRGT